MKKTVYSMLQVLFMIVFSTCGILSVDAQTSYQLVKSDADIVAGGKYIIASMTSGDGFVMKKYVSGNNCKAEAAKSADGSITGTADMAELSLESVSDGVWAFMDADGKYMTVTSTKKNIIQFVIPKNEIIDEWSKFTIVFSEAGEAIIKSTSEAKSNYTVRFNNQNASNPLFATYKSGQEPVYLYKADSSTPSKELTGISISGNPTKTTYKEGETPSADGLTVTATYSDESTAEVTSSVKWTFTPETLTLETKQLTATATYGEKTADITFGVTVEKKDVVVEEGYDYSYSLERQSYVFADNDKVEWNANVSSMILEKDESSTRANNYVGPEKTEIRIYSGQKLTITPKVGITKIVLVAHEFDGSKTDVKEAFKQENITNATLQFEEQRASSNIKNVILTPTNTTEPVVIKVAGKMGIQQLIQTYQPITVNIGEAGCATLCIPYNANIPEKLSAYAAKDNGDKVTLIERGDNLIAANEGLVVKGEKGQYELKASSEEPQLIDGNDMVGVLQDTQLDTNSNAYLLTQKKDGGSIAFRLLQTNYTLAANRAYLSTKVQDPGRVLLSVYDAVETGIDAVEDKEETDTRNAAIYNLSGQRMHRMHKGINIVNGKLVLR